MDDEKRKLATAWRDLAGWHAGMRLLAKEDKVYWADESDAAAWNDATHAFGHVLPDPEAPANWGVWLEWAWCCGSRVDLARSYGGCVALCRSPDVHSDLYPTPAAALLDLCCRALEASELPPSVTAWWAEVNAEPE